MQTQFVHELTIYYALICVSKLKVLVENQKSQGYLPTFKINFVSFNRTTKVKPFTKLNVSFTYHFLNNLQF